MDTEGQQLCRACLSGDSTKAADEDFIEIFQKCTAVPVEELENVPFFICIACAGKTNELNTFREKCLESHDIFRKLSSDKNVVEEVMVQAKVKDEPDDEEEDLNSYKLFEDLPSVEDLPEDLDPVEVEVESEDIGVTIVCTICRKNFNSKPDLIKHTELLHCTNDYKCSVCQETFQTPDLLNFHSRKHDKEKTSVAKKFECDRCDKSYTTLVNLKIHMYSHLGMKPYKCSYCARAFTKESSLNAHITIHTGSRNYLCTECGKMFASNFTLTRHRAVHTGIRPHKCNICPVSFVSTGDLKIHMRSHTGEKPYLCSTCGKSFRRSTHLSTHRRTHTGEKPYKCPTCDKAFTQSGDLKAHKRTHTGEKPFVCRVCDKRFCQYNALASHNKNQHFKCAHCTKKFTRQEKLERHNRLCHGSSMLNSFQSSEKAIQRQPNSDTVLQIVLL